jgi:hypothetical protein
MGAEDCEIDTVTVEICAEAGEIAGQNAGAELSHRFPRA